MDHQPPNQPHSIREIGHLFLSSVRDRQTAGAPRPQRTPPAKPPAPPVETHSGHNEPTIDLTPEEFAQVLSDAEPQSAPDKRASLRLRQVAKTQARPRDGPAHSETECTAYVKQPSDQHG